MPSEPADENQNQNDSNIQDRPEDDTEMIDDTSTEYECKNNEASTYLSYLNIPSIKDFDVIDSVGRWTYGKVIELNEFENKVLVTFPHWSSKFDTWIDIHPNNIALYGTHIYRIGGVLKVGQRIEVYDNHPSQMKWVEAFILETNERYVKVTFKGWSSKFDEWISRDSDRICPHGTHLIKRIIISSSSNQYWNTHERKRQIQSNDSRQIQYVNGLSSLGYNIFPVRGDGNCLFRSVSHQIYGNDSYHDIVRSKCLDYMVVEKEFFHSFVVGDMNSFMLYIENKRRLGEWGDDIEIQAMCEIYDRPAEIFAFDSITGARKLKTFHGGRTGISRPPIRLSYYGGGHYDSILSNNTHTFYLNTTPGEHEDIAIIGARETRESLTEGNIELQASRNQYENSSDNIDSVLLQSLECLEKQSMDELNAALNESNVTQTQEALFEAVRIVSEREEIQKAIDASIMEDPDLSAALEISMSNNLSNVIVESEMNEDLRAALAASLHDIPRVFICNVCTYTNEGEGLTCAVCGTPLHDMIEDAIYNQTHNDGNTQD